MVAESTIEPKKVKKNKNKIYLRKNIQQVTKETEKGTEDFWQWDERVIKFKTPLSENNIEQKFDYFWNLGGKRIANEKRKKRNELLKETDKYVLEDFPLTTAQETEIKNYRQNLRDLTNQSSNPEEWVFPEKPSFVNL